jgi:hypothetical protein
MDCLTCSSVTAPTVAQKLPSPQRLSPVTLAQFVELAQQSIRGATLEVRRPLGWGEVSRGTDPYRDGVSPDVTTHYRHALLNPDPPWINSRRRRAMSPRNP